MVTNMADDAVRDVNFISYDFSKIWDNFPYFTNLPPDAAGVMEEIHKYAPGATSCCIQLSYALNAAGIKVPERSYRRPNFRGKSGDYYFGAPDEVDLFLENAFFPGENIKNMADPSLSNMKTYLGDRWGILVFYETRTHLGPRAHTELWNLSTIKQSANSPAGMSEGGIFSNKTVLFWDFA